MTAPQPGDRVTIEIRDAVVRIPIDYGRIIIESSNAAAAFWIDPDHPAVTITPSAPECPGY